VSSTSFFSFLFPPVNPCLPSTFSYKPFKLFFFWYCPLFFFFFFIWLIYKILFCLQIHSPLIFSCLLDLVIIILIFLFKFVLNLSFFFQFHPLFFSHSIFDVYNDFHTYPHSIIVD
jgi:hypothetical protein